MTSVWPGKLVILDEPTNDVDPLRRRMLWAEIRRLGEAGTAVLLVTHNVLEAEKSVDRLAIINEGRLIAEGHVVVVAQGYRQWFIAASGDAGTRNRDTGPSGVRAIRGKGGGTTWSLRLPSRMHRPGLPGPRD